MDPHRAGLVYALGTGYFLRSTDAGATWSPFASSLGQLYPFGLRVDPTNSDILYVNTSAGLSRSDDAGVTWRTVLGSSLRLVVISASDGRRLYGRVGDGVTTSGDGGVTWQSSSSGLVATRIFLLAADPGSPARLYALVEPAMLYERRDAVSDWDPLASFGGVPLSLTVAVFFTRPRWAAAFLTSKSCRSDCPWIFPPADVRRHACSCGHEGGNGVNCGAPGRPA